MPPHQCSEANRLLRIEKLMDGNGRYVLDLYYADLKLKENLMRCFPTWDENLLEITTKPIE